MRRQTNSQAALLDASTSGLRTESLWSIVIVISRLTIVSVRTLSVVTVTLDFSIRSLANNRITVGADWISGIRGIPHLWAPLEAEFRAVCDVFENRRLVR